MFDAQGKRYVDAMASLWYCAIGHGRTEMAEAIRAQVETLEAFHCFDVFTNEPAEALCAALAALSPVPEARVFLTSSGSEAVDTALKLARQVFALQGQPERHLIVGRQHAYHGVTYGGLSVMGLPANQTGWGPLLDGVHSVAHDDLSSAEALFAQRGDQIAAVIAEPVIGAGGVRPPADGYLEGLRDLCDSYGALLILDEVITGFGRLGHWWGAQRYGVRPDLLTFAKGATSGYQPLGGVLVGRAVRDVLEADPTFVLRTGHTYSGHPTGCRAALVNIAILRDEALLPRAEAIGARVEPALRAMADDGLVSEVRGVSGMWAVDMVDDVSAVDIRSDLLGRGVVVRPIGTTTIALCPPLVITDEDLDHCTRALAESLGERVTQ